MIFLSWHTTWDEFHITPSIIIRETTNKDGVFLQLIVHWFFWAGMLTWARV